MAKENEANAAKKDNAPAEANNRSRLRTIILAAVVIAIVGTTAGIAIYRERIAPFNTVIVAVNGVEMDMRYFLNRLNVSGAQSMELLSTLTQEEILRQLAPQPPYNIVLTEEDVDNFGKEVAKGSDETITEEEYQEWYRQQVNESGFSEEVYRELLRTSLLRLRMQEYLAARLPTSADQVFINVIMLGQNDYPLGQEIKERFDAGEDFVSLSDQYSTNPQLKANDGKFGWFPDGALDKAINDAAFDLEIGELSDPFFANDDVIVLVMVSDKEEDREISEQSMNMLRSKVLDKWFNEQFNKHDVEFHGFKGGGYDSETDAWVQWQLMRMRRNDPPDEESEGAA